MTKAVNQFYSLTPEAIFSAVERAGWSATGEILQLNSYENRVFLIRLEGQPREIIAKFYRPQRWSLAAIQEEHVFLNELKESGIPAVAALPILFETEGILTTFFPRASGRIPADLPNEELVKIGRLLARVHNVGSLKASRHRHVFDPLIMGKQALQILQPLLDPLIKERYVLAANTILEFLDHHLDRNSFIRIHGDCHRGNLLQRDVPNQPKEYFLLDFDDFGMGPVAQDFWMLCLGDEEEANDQLAALLSGYRELREFDDSDLIVLEPLRGMRIIHYAAWIARRWEDPSFPQLFPQFASSAYWLEELQSLEGIADSL